eukprot:COSAG01_NODE_71363_length_256_cov_0.649682_1_plen_34_part_10
MLHFSPNLHRVNPVELHVDICCVEDMACSCGEIW